MDHQIVRRNWIDLEIRNLLDLEYRIQSSVDIHPLRALGSLEYMLQLNSSCACNSRHWLGREQNSIRELEMNLSANVLLDCGRRP